MNKIQIFYFFLIVLIPSVVFSQISITKSDFTSFYSIGNTYYSFSDTLTESIDIGQPGGGNNWNFTNLTAHEMFGYEYIAPSATPHADSFATADLATYFNLMSDTGNGTTFSSETWSYYNTNDATILGSIGNNTFTDTNGTIVTLTVSRHYPPFIEYDFPITFNNMWTSKDSSETTTYSVGSSGFVAVTTTVYDGHIDAWGTMTMPSGKVVDALRSREVSTTTTYFSGFPTSTSTLVYYSFMGKNGESLSISADDENPSNSGVINGSLNWSNDNITSVEKLETLPKNFALKQNFPNPYNPSTIIEYSIPKVSLVKLKVFDILGNEVVELVNESQISGIYKYEFDGSKLSSGTYLLQLRANDLMEARKITLLK